MSEREIKKQIKKLGNEWCKFMLESEEDYCPFSHEQGRELQDKVATNRTVDEIREFARRYFISDVRGSVMGFIEELEKLRR